MNVRRDGNLSAVHLSTPELEQLLDSEFTKLGLEQFVVMIVNGKQQPVYQYICGFSDKQIQVYEQHMAHDVFFRHYARNRYFGQLIYMQEMLPLQKIRNPVFNEILVPTMQLYYSYCGLAPLMNDHYVMLSSHSDKALDFCSRNSVDAIWHFLNAWGNYWVAHQAMSMQLNQFESSQHHRLPVSELTDAELTVLNMLAQGLDGSEVAIRRNVSKETVRSQIKHILHKTGCRHQNQLLTRYFQSGIQGSSSFMTLSPNITSLI